MDGYVKNRKILLTGASGLIGKCVLETFVSLHRNECEVYCLSRRKFRSSDNIHWLECDLSDYSKVESIISSVKPDTIVHLAWHIQAEIHSHVKESIELMEHSIHLFESFMANEGKLFINAGTMHENDALFEERYFHHIPASIYGTCKFCLRKILFALKKAYKSPINIVWPQIGWGFSENEPHGRFFSHVYQCLLDNTPITLVYEHLRLPYIYVKHIGSVIVNYCLDLQQDVIFPLTSLKPIELENIIKKMACLLNKTISINYNLKGPSEEYKLDLKAIPNSIYKYLEQIDFDEDIRFFLKGKNNG